MNVVLNKGTEQKVRKSYKLRIVTINTEIISGFQHEIFRLIAYCCNLSVGVAFNVRFTTNGMCAKNNTHIYVARTSNNRVIAAHDLYYCLLP